MSHDYITRTKKESVVSSECLQTLEANIINNINRLKDEIISLKDIVIKRLQEENERLRDKCQQLENRVALIESSHDALIVCTPPPLSAGGEGEGGSLNLQPYFQKRGGLTGPQLLEGGCWERGG